MAPRSTRLLVAIPCLNEAATIGQVIGGIPQAIDGVDEVVVLVVDDGSTDATAETARSAGARVVSHGHNRGVGAAFQTALAYAVDGRFDFLVNIDADGQFDPTDIPKLVGPIAAGEAHFVTASRFLDPGLIPDMPRVKLWGNHRMSSLISALAGAKFHDVSCGFRAYSREAMLHLNLHGRFTYTQETFLDLSSKGLRLLEVPVRVRYFKERRSRVAGSIPAYAIKTLSIIVRSFRDYHPIRFFWSIASGFVLAGSGFAAIMLAHYVRTGRFTGQLWAGFTGGFLLTVGLGFFVLGIVADMLDRQRRNQERILYLLKKQGSAPDGHPEPST